MKVKVRLHECPFGYYVKTKPKKIKRVKVKKREPGFTIDGTRITRKSILGNKYLTGKEREALLDMCYGVTTRKVKVVNKSKRYKRPIAKYYVDGTVFYDGSFEEISEFYGI